MLADALEGFYAAEGLPPGGTDGAPLDWVSAFGVALPVPNTAARLWVLPYHDLHHVITGYRTDEAGEGEVAAWTLASGGGPALGRLYDLGAFLIGMARWPERTSRAFFRGRRATNTYGVPRERLFDLDLDALRAASGPLDPRPTAADRRALAAWVAVAAAVWGGPLAPVVAASFLRGRAG